jgi:hypothetical protein
MVHVFADSTVLRAEMGVKEVWESTFLTNHDSASSSRKFFGDDAKGIA